MRANDALCDCESLARGPCYKGPLRQALTCASGAYKVLLWQALTCALERLSLVPSILFTCRFPGSRASLREHHARASRIIRGAINLRSLSSLAVLVNVVVVAPVTTKTAPATDVTQPMPRMRFSYAAVSPTTYGVLTRTNQDAPTKLPKVFGDRFEKMILSDRIVDSPRVLASFLVALRTLRLHR